MKNVNNILDKLELLYPDACCELEHSNPFELLIATILSAQCTDVRVNQVTRVMFEKYKTPQDFMDLTTAQIGEEIKSCGLQKSKSEKIKEACRILVQDYNGQVPSNMEDLVKLPGVGRKTANVVLSDAFGIPAIAVDTHVFRVSNRIGIVDCPNVDKTEIELMRVIPKQRWSHSHHLLIFHGRRMCKARNPECEQCPIKGECKYFKTKKE